jgi:hypothetical protein
MLDGSTYEEDKVMQVPITSGHASNVFYRCRLQALTNTSDIWGNYLPWGLTNTYRTHYSLESYQSLDSTFYMPLLTSENEGVQITFTMDQVAKEYIISPASLPDSIIKLGSLLGLLKLFILFSLANEWYFEKTLDSRYSLTNDKKVSPTKDNEEPLLEPHGLERDLCKAEDPLGFRDLFSF